MTTFTEGRHSQEFLLSEGNRTISREQVALESGQGVIPAGTLLNAALEVSDVSPIYVLLNEVDTGEELDSDVDVQAAVIARYAEVHGDALSWQDGTNAAAKLAAAESLKAQGIFVRWTVVPS